MRRLFHKTFDDMVRSELNKEAVREYKDTKEKIDAKNLYQFSVVISENQ